MNIDDYRYIVALAETGNLTSAARSLFISQPALSQRIKHIESIYNITILKRDAKGIQLTEEGECLLQYAKQILCSESDLRRALANIHQEQQSTIRIGTSTLISSAMFDQLIVQFHKEVPSVKFEFIERRSIELQELLLSGDIDIAICYGPITSDALKYEIIFEDKYVIIPARGSTLEQKIRADHILPGSVLDCSYLEGETLALPSPGTKLHTFVMSMLEKNHVTIQEKQFGQNYSVLYSFAKAGIASAIVCESFFNPDQEHDPFYYLEQGEYRGLLAAVVWRRGSFFQRSAKTFVEIAQELFGTS